MAEREIERDCQARAKIAKAVILRQPALEEPNQNLHNPEGRICQAVSLLRLIVHCTFVCEHWRSRHGEVNRVVFSSQKDCCKNTLFLYNITSIRISLLLLQIDIGLCCKQCKTMGIFSTTSKTTWSNHDVMPWHEYTELRESHVERVCFEHGKADSHVLDQRENEVKS